VTLKEIEKDLVRHKVAVVIPPGLPLARMDFVLMQQALTNLLLNAATHTQPGTSVQVTVTADNQTLVIAVADTGPGLAPDIVERIFDKFYRAPAAAVGGTGLGLSIVKGFMEAQGGQVQAANRPGGGAVFTLCLPLSDPPPVTPEASL
jgi:two-component system sensor histidine kinase KdpD